MDKKDCFNLGHVSKVFGIKGEVVLYLDVDTPEKYAGLKLIYIEIDGLLNEFELESIRLKKNYAFVKIKGINKIEEAEKVLKCEIFLPLSFLPDLGDKNFYLHEVIGFQVFDEVYGDIGKLETIIDVPSQRLLQINGKQEILIPLNDAFINKVDRPGKALFISTPEGLIDVYLNPDNKGE